MSEDQTKGILIKLADHEKRLRQLERTQQVYIAGSVDSKQKTLREIVKDRTFKNGQEQVAVIVGYNEKILDSLTTKDKIKDQWIAAKMTNKFSAEFISRAKDVLVRVHSDETCDLTQSGEEFFEKFLKNEPTKSTSK